MDKNKRTNKTKEEGQEKNYVRRRASDRTGKENAAARSTRRRTRLEDQVEAAARRRTRDDDHTPELRKRKRALTPEEKELLRKRRQIKAEKQRLENAGQAQRSAEEAAKLRRERQRLARERRKRQLMIRIIATAVCLVAAFFAVSAISRLISRKKLEPNGGAGSNILAAAEAANGAEGSAADAPDNTADGASGNPNGTTDTLDTAGNGTPVESEGIPVTGQQTQNSNELSICMVGDVILHQRLLDASRTEAGYNFSNLFANVTAEVQKYDIKIANQETILGGEALEYTGYPAFNSPYEEADALVNAGFNVILQATNHSLDKGQSAVQNCLHYWNSMYPQIPVLGIHDANEPSTDNVCLFEKNGIVVAILNYTYGSNKYQEELAGELAGEVNILDPQLVKQDVDTARRIADYVIVCPHWGVENELEPSSEQEMWTSLFLDCGVDLVLGTHPHVIQPIQLYTRGDGHQMLVYYSLGNFISNQEDKNGNVGGMAQIVIRKEDNGSISLVNYGVRTTVTHESLDGEAFTTYFLDEYPEELAPANEVTATDPEFSYSYCWDLRDRIFGQTGKIEIG